MKYFAVIVLLALAAMALAKPVEEEKAEKGKLGLGIGPSSVGGISRDKRGVFVETYTAPLTYSAYSAVPLTYHTSYSVPHTYTPYTYRSYPAYYSSPLVVY